jgi:hypothetical protein
MLFQCLLYDRRKDIPELALAGWHDFDDPGDHLSGVATSFCTANQVRYDLAHRIAFGKVNGIIQPAECVLGHRFVKACQVGARIDGLDLDPKRVQLVSHRFRDRFDRMLEGMLLQISAA